MIGSKTRAEVRERAENACEYCRLRQDDSPLAALHVQGTHSETLAAQRVPNNTWLFFDPRNKQASQVVAVGEGLLERFNPGKALLRATATGRPQLTRLPPPLVREIEVEIQH